ncbi:MAG: T9SS type A sorting domain-containing protein [Bacteroidia bacterium]|nr:T9SS type A sorting domain-containing protein [Bacteroidia bacterium]
MTASPEILLPDHGLRIFPNPASSTLTIEFPGSGPNAVTINTISGTRVLSFEHITGGSITIDTGNLLAGIYIVTVSGAGGVTYTRKVIVD